MRPFPILLAAWVPLTALGQEAPQWPLLRNVAEKQPLPGSAPLESEGDLSMEMIAGIDRFLDGEIARAMESRKERGGSRDELARKLGTPRDARPKENALQYLSVTPGPYAAGEAFTVYEVRWKAFGGVEGAGLLLDPAGPPLADVIALPGAGREPEEVCGVAPLGGPGKGAPYAGRLAAAGCRVLVPS